MSSELGDIDEEATKRTFDRLSPDLMRCYSAGLERLEYLGGDVAVWFRVGADGRLRWAFFDQSTLGDRVTEACMLRVLTAAQWPRPDGGEAEVHHTFGFDPPADVKAPTTWHVDQVAGAIAESLNAVAACRRHGAGPFSVTAYVGPNGTVGRVLAAGAVVTNAQRVADVDCVLDVVERMRLPNPGDAPAKVSFSL
jgi:hypothetical protein